MMIKLNKKEASSAPAILNTKGAEETKKLEEAYNADNADFQFDSKIYGHTSVKSTLITLQDGKCCFCESEFTHTGYGDVEHYRPKGGWIQDTEKLNQPGYYWLAYSWDNLILSCQLCNQKFKKNYFPLVNNDDRARSHQDDINLEQPLLVHPVFDNPEEHITFQEEIPKPVDKSERGEVSIKKFGLDRDKLNDRRRSTLTPIKQIYNIAKNFPPTDGPTKQEAREYILEHFESSKKDSTEYASMLRSFFRQNPVDF